MTETVPQRNESLLRIYTRDLNPQTLKPIPYGKNNRTLAETSRLTTEKEWMTERVNGSMRSNRHGDYILSFTVEQLGEERIAVETWLYKPENTKPQG